MSKSEDLSNLNIFKKSKKGKAGRPKKTKITKTAEAVNKNTTNTIQVDSNKNQKKSRQNKNKAIVWRPFPPLQDENGVNLQAYSSQEMFLNMDHIDEILYTGSRFIGKSDALVASFLKYVQKGYGVRWRGVVVRMTYKALQDIIKKAKKIIYAAYSEDEVKFLAGDQLMFKWKTGEELHFRSCATEKDYEDKFHGQEYTWIGIDELTSWPDDTVYVALLSCNRVDYLEDEPNPPVMMRCTTNPSGKGRNWVKKYFIDPKPMGQIITETFEEDGEEYKTTRVSINGHWSENPYADRKYIAKLFKLEKSDYAKFRAWLYGDWNVVLGGMFGDIWKPHIHMIDPFELNQDFYIDRSYDDGTHDPFSVLFWAEAIKDTLINVNGEDRLIPMGSLILIHEIYGAKQDDPKKGLYLSTKKIAEKVLDSEKRLRDGLLKFNKEIHAGPADYMIWKNKKVVGEKTIAQRFKDAGVNWKKAKKHGDKYNRVNRVRVMQDMLMSSVDDDKDSPQFYVFNTCRNWISNVINLQRDEANPEDIDQSQPDHDWDATGYRITVRRSKVEMNYS